METNALNIVYAIEVANQLREAFDEPQLEDLPKGLKNNSSQCILARAFNFKCAVVNFKCAVAPSATVWFVEFNGEHHAQAAKLAEVLGVEVSELPKICDCATCSNSKRYRVSLPREIGQIATAFDAGHLQQYVEWSEPETP